MTYQIPVFVRGRGFYGGIGQKEEAALFLYGLPDLGNDTAQIKIAQFAGLSGDCRRRFHPCRKQKG